jgi:hypothetical protein
MAISVDTVYKTVLLILNKEQRGYMTPDEFNKIGSQVQREIFEAYFEDLNQQLRIPQSDVEYSDRVAITDEKIAEFKVEGNATHTQDGIFTLPSDLYRLGSLTFEDTNKFPVEIQRVGRADFYNIRKSPLTAPTTTHPIYLYEDNKALVYPTSITSKIKTQYVKKPNDIRWGYYSGNLGQLIHDTTVFGANLLNNGGTLSSITTNPTSITTDQTYTNLTTTVSPAGGTGAIVSAVVSGGTVTSVLVTTPGSGYSIGDVLTVSQAQLPGGSSDLDITLTAADFNSGSTYGTTNFELHNSERTELVLKMLLYQGVVIRDPQIVQVAASRVQQEEVNEKS